MSVTRRGTSWQVVYPDPSKRSGRGSKTFARKLDADRFEAKQKIDALQGLWVDPDAGKITVEDYLAQWLAGHHIRKSTRKRYTRYLAIICEDLGAWQLGQLRTSRLREWQTELAKRYALSSVRVIRGMFATALKAAVVDRLIRSSPFDDVPTIKLPRKLVRPVSLSYVQGMAEAINPRYRAAVLVGAMAGLRRGECMGLTVDRVDLLRKVVLVDRQVNDDGEFADVKTPASVGDVPVPQMLIDALAAHITKWRPERTMLIFTTARGGPVTDKTFAKAWQKADQRRWAIDKGMPLDNRGRITAAIREAYKLAHPQGCPTRFHDLRHFYASTLIAGGRSVKEVQERLRHASAVETLQTYSHLFPGSDEGTRAAIEAAFKPDEAGPTKMGEAQ